MDKGWLSYDELLERLRQAEAAIESIRKGDVDLILSAKGPLLVRLKALVEENERLSREWQKTFDAVSDSIILLDRDQKIIRYNQATLQLFNLTPGEIEGRKCCEIFHGSETPAEDCPATRVCRSMKRKSIEMQIAGKDFFVTVDPVFNDTNELVSFVHTISDITEKKKTEKQLRLLGKAVEYSGVSVIITDISGNIEYTNPGFTAITGYSSAEAHGQNPRFLKSGKQPKEFYENLWNTILSGHTWEGEIINKRKNGDLYWEKAIISPITDINGKITHFVAIKEDITEKKRILEELIKAKDAAEESTRLKSAFLSNISHEIRTPLNGILGFTEILKNYGLSDSEKEVYFGMLKDSAERMLHTINEIIEMSKIESGTVSVELKPVNIREFIVYLYNFFKPFTDKKGLGLVYNLKNIKPDFAVETDPYKIETILSNMLDNAVKFTEKGIIEFGAEVEGDEVSFFCRDTGCGIPHERLKSIFHRFVQADISHARPYEGVGLGLSIAQSYAELLGGAITVESEEGKGSVFRFAIPVRIPCQAEGITEKTEKNILTGQHRNIKILVAEDDDMNFFYIDTLLKKDGFSTVRAKDGIETVDLVKNSSDIGLVLMDVKMPGMDGITATREIRKFNRSLPIIAQTAYAMDADKEKALNAGCNDYISKPFTRSSLLMKIKNYTG